MNEVRVGYSHYYQVFEPQDATENPANYSFNGNTYNLFTGQTNPLYFGFPGLSISGLSGALGPVGQKSLVLTVCCRSQTTYRICAASIRSNSVVNFWKSEHVRRNGEC